MTTKNHKLEPLSGNYFLLIGAKISSLRADGVDVIRLDMGSPDFPPPADIVEALTQSATQADHHGYQPFFGHEPLRQAWADMYQRLFEVKLDPENEIVPLLGSKEGIFNLTLAYVNPDDLVLVPDPAYPIYERGARFAGGDVVFMPLLKDDGYLPNFSNISPDVARRARLLWLNYPNNPTTATAGSEFFASAVKFAKEYDILLCHDAAYCQVTFGGFKAPSILQVPGAEEVAVEFNSLSKSHNMAGWRVGAAVGNLHALQALRALKPHIDSGHFRPIMDAATYALTGDQSWIDERNETYRKRRDLVVQKLNALGLQAASPQASLYVWAPIPEGWSSEDFTNTLLEDTGVSLMPGSFFGAHGEGYVRISLVASSARITEAFDRISDWWLPAIK